MNKIADMDPIDSILAVAAMNLDQRYKFYRAFFDLELVVLGSATVDNHESDETELILKYIEVGQEFALPVFSSEAKFYTIFQDNYSFVKITARELLPLIEPEASLVLNPGFGQTKKIIPEEIKTLQDGSILQYFFDQLSPEAKKKSLGEQIIEVPETTLVSLAECLRNFPSIKKAFLTYIFDPVRAEEPGPLIGLEIEDKELSATLLLSIVELVNKTIQVQSKLEFVILDEKLPLTESTMWEVPPFYIRNLEEELRSMFR